MEQEILFEIKNSVGDSTPRFKTPYEKLLDEMFKPLFDKHILPLDK